MVRETFDASGNRVERMVLERSTEGRTVEATLDRYDADGHQTDHLRSVDGTLTPDSWRERLVAGPEGSFVPAREPIVNLSEAVTAEPATPNTPQRPAGPRAPGRTPAAPPRNAQPQAPNRRPRNEAGAGERPERNAPVRGGSAASPPNGGRQTGAAPPLATHPDAASLDPRLNDILSRVRERFPAAGIRSTSGVRTVHEQAQLMATRARANGRDFLANYGAGAYAREMLNWVGTNPGATHDDTTRQFEAIITRVRAAGSFVSNHIASPGRPATAMDLSLPRGGPEVRRAVENLIQELGGRVHPEPNAPTGPHLHIDVPQPGRGRAGRSGGRAR